MDKTEKLLKALSEYDDQWINAAIIIHMDKVTKEAKTITPIVPAANLKELYVTLSSCRDAIQNFLNEMLNKGLTEGGRNN